ncbi:MAG: 4-hydroxy-tetrahydrodipicolinate synthase [Actinobacteria bacterium]|nr:4-hydroxy-tetrahydrodipicolinate synthase [Actinomycetota bacterium]MBV8958988.1 4-hydroxy-tetrahydrodipicolinate synthase [Actinomycetota bacterium]MBV9254406.1 4-hydroxy-tetrahydrodipicolinate synthase [Actinomycetota bacterium]MBV9662336.1 4-hydroxy-tetrahydrodipicolinate synthase [Actinomycetota bacterium]
MATIPGRFGAVLTAMVTPFDANGALDLDTAAQLARWLVDHGNDGLVVTGTTGEGPVLTDEEEISLWKAVREAVSVPIVAGAGTNDTRHSVQQVKAAEAAGVDGILAVTPYYNRPSQAGIEGHFRAIAAATSLPVMLYDIPIRTGRKIAHDTLIRLITEVPNIVAVKDAALDVSASARLVADAPDDFDLYSGNDDQTLPLLSIGAVGVVGVATHWAGTQMGEMIAAFSKGDVDEARRLNARMLESYDFESGDLTPNPVPAKAMMRVLGIPVGECRLPNAPAPAGLEDRARDVLARLG